ncbi:MAG: aminotransferase class V-fold PLP-dependent enzyme [Candidatus Melainabacteria bacterium]|nr:aminotransferase class V-fold PLP-dependent enzyme [Candidatus Melainabacteria bacterium]
MVNKAYLDHLTATRPLPAAIEAMLPFYREQWGSTTSPHQMGQELFPALERHTEAILEMLGAKKEDKFYFFSSSAEAISHLFLSFYFDTVRETGKNHLLTTNVEEAPVLMALKKLEDVGCAGKILPVNSQGQLTRAMLEEHLRPRTALLSLSWANGLTGVVHPIADLAEACKAKDVRVHVDASAVIGKQYFRFEDLNVDFLTFDGSLLHAPKGTAGLLVKEKTPFTPPSSSIMGIPVGGVAALSSALVEVANQFDHLCLETVRLRDKLEKGVLSGVPGATVLFQNVERVPHTSAILFPGVVSDALLFLLNRKRVFATLGGGRMQKLSHILVASGIDETLAQCALSFTLSFETTEEEIDYAIQAIVEAARQLQALSQSIVGEI